MEMARCIACRHNLKVQVEEGDGISQILIILESRRKK